MKAGILKQNKGFTLIELLIVLAIIGSLASAISLVAPSMMAKGQVQRAQLSVDAIAKALIIFNADLDVWPTKGEGDDGNFCDVKLLFTANFNPKSDTFNLSNRTIMTDSAEPDAEVYYRFPDASLPSGNKTYTTEWKALMSSSDIIDRHLQLNGGGYDINGKTPGWPYLNKIGLDPWQNSYLVSIGGFSCDMGDVGTGDTNLVWVLSAGPNGAIETPLKIYTGKGGTATQSLTPPRCGGDDICSLLGSQLTNFD